MNPFDKKLSRRNFVALVGGSCAVIGAAGLVPRGARADRREPPPHRRRRPSVEKLPVGEMRRISTEVLVVGGGMAGVFAAVKAHDAGAEVVLVDKGSVGRSGQTPFARGIFRYDPETSGMSRDEVLAAVAEASENMNNPVYTSLLLQDSAARCDDLQRWGFFDSVAIAGSLRKPLEERGIPIYERVTLTHLLKADGRIAGAAGVFLDENGSLAIRAKSVILCTGASGFKPTGWQIGSLTSDGDAMAYRIGAEITGKEWCDGHAMTNPGLEGSTHIVSEPAISPMLGVEVNVEVSRDGVPEGMGPPPGADGDRPDGPPSGGPPSDGNGERPGGPPSGGDGERRGPPPGNLVGGVSAGMSQHKAEGLFPADDRCASNIPGLYAAGDALGSMQSGGVYTQVGSSLAGSAVQGAVAGESAAEYVLGVGQGRVSADTLRELNTEIYAPLQREQGFLPQWVTQTLQGVMIPNFILYVKSAARLEAALTYVEYLRDHQVPLLVADDLHELRQAHETANMILNAEMKLRASLLRTESRGSHYREDYPERDDDEWLAWIKISRGEDGGMRLAKHSVPRS